MEYRGQKEKQTLLASQTVISAYLRAPQTEADLIRVRRSRHEVNGFVPGFFSWDSSSAATPLSVLCCSLSPLSMSPPALLHAAPSPTTAVSGALTGTGSRGGKERDGPRLGGP